VIVERTIKKDITRCYHECPFFSTEGGPSPVMVCEHPDAPDEGVIISHPKCREGFPDKCPLA
jgi:hypothetical protein